MMRKLKLKVIHCILSGVVLFLVVIGRSSGGYSSSTAKVRETQVTTSSTTEEVREELPLVDSILQKMTLEEKVGQLFLARVPEQNQIDDMRTYHLGGYLLFGRDFENQTLASIKETISKYQAASPIPLLIASDEEGGTVTRISQLLETPLPSPMTSYQRGGLEAIKEDTSTKADLLLSVGINASLSPVADVTTDSHSFIYDRTIGKDARETAQYVRTSVEAMSAKHLGSTLKHFPGYGSNGDSHTAIIYDRRPLSQLQNEDLLPFKAVAWLIAEGWLVGI